jgi:hypothetical protein
MSSSSGYGKANNLADIFQQAHALAPRVGNRILQEGPIYEAICLRYPEYRIYSVVLCRGVNRYRPPPETDYRINAPWRRTIFWSRDDGRYVEDGQWEKMESFGKATNI